jgi:ketosteroid isomerase-like protein
MSRQNEQVARRAYDAFSRGDFEALAALLHPEVEFESLLLEMEAGSYRGLEGAREYFESVREVFPD